jgi:endonuclease/exonuclease/phosphatase family metal-dependent hydrolase
VNKRDEAAAEDYRLLDAKHVEQVVEMLRSEWDVPVIFGGDFNCRSDEKAWNHLGERYNNVQLSCPDTENNTTWHNPPMLDKELGIYTTVAFPSGAPTTSIDRIYTAGEGVEPQVFDIVTDRYALYGADHTPLIMDFNWN